jgi:serine/threonine protein kinase
MSGRPQFFTQLVEQLDNHLSVINQAVHASSPAALEDVVREVGPRGLVLVEIWRLLWPEIEKDDTWRQLALDRMTRREPWTFERFRQMIGDILLADATLPAKIKELISPEEQAEVVNISAGNESTLIAHDHLTEITQEQRPTAPDTLVLSEAGPWSSGFLLAGRFKLVRLLASGGFGEAWLAKDIAETSSMACVVKRFSFQHSDANVLDDIRRRFEREARILERLGAGHDQIPSLHFFETGGNEGYFVQEYIEGPNLAELVRDEGPMSESEVLDFLDSVLGVLSYVHNERVIHRDIKPANIILRKADGKPVLIDFGSLKEIATTVLDRFGHASTTLAIGTPGFMPIEQMQGRPRLSTDIYALGFTVLYLLSGRLPADLINVATGDVEWSDLVPILSPELRGILETATAQMPDGRFKSVRHMHDEIRQLMQGMKPKPQIEAERWPQLEQNGGHVIASQFSPQVMATPSPIRVTDEEIESFLMLEFSGERGGRWRIWIEQLRDHTAGLWSTLGRRSNRMSFKEYHQLVETNFRPVMDRLLLTGLLTIKYDAGIERFRDVIDLLVAIFQRWPDAQRIAPWPDGTRTYPPEMVSESIPALEAYFAAFALLGFTLRVSPDVRYAGVLFPQVVTFAPFGKTEPYDVALLFWAYDLDESPDQDIDNLIASRMPQGGRIESLFEGKEGLQEAIVQADCYVEWHSNLSQSGDIHTPYGSPETVNFFRTFLPNLSFHYLSICRSRPTRLVMPLLRKIHQSLRGDATQFSSFDFRLASILDAMSVEARELLLGRFLWYLAREQASISYSQRRLPPTLYWPKPFDQLVTRAKDESKILRNLRQS